MPRRELLDLTDAEVSERLQNSSRLSDKRAEIESLSRLVFGNSQAVSASVERISDTQSGAAARDDLRSGRLGELAGEGRKWLRPPDRERQAAEAHLPRLAAALEDYGRAADFEKHQIVMQHRDEQARQRVEIPSPSRKLVWLLSSEGDERFRMLQGDQSLKRELDRLSLALTKRLSSADQAGLKAGGLAAIAKAHGIDERQALEVQKAYSQVRGMQQEMTARVRERSRAETVALVRR